MNSTLSNSSSNSSDVSSLSKPPFPTKSHVMFTFLVSIVISITIIILLMLLIIKKKGESQKNKNIQKIENPKYKKVPIANFELLSDYKNPQISTIYSCNHDNFNKYTFVPSRSNPVSQIHGNKNKMRISTGSGSSKRGSVDIKNFQSHPSLSKRSISSSTTTLPAAVAASETDKNKQAVTAVEKTDSSSVSPSPGEVKEFFEGSKLRTNISDLEVNNLVLKNN